MSDSKINKTKSSDYWKSLKEYYDDPEILKAKANEFQDGVTDDFDPSSMSGLSRRKFLALMTASAALTATACSDYRDKGEIIPYTNRPEGLLPGKPGYYASTINDGNESYGVLVKTREGRPIKVDGNPDHPINKGKINAKIHASLLDLYDPERITDPMKAGRKSDWATVNTEIISKLEAAKTNGKEIAILTNSINSPSSFAVLQKFIEKYPTTKLYSYELHNNANRLNGWKRAYSADSILPAIKWNEAKIILNMDSDFLGREGNTIENSLLFADSRDIMKSDDFNRLYSVEAGMSLTGMNSDYRIRLSAESYYEFVLSLLNEIVVKRNVSAFPVNSQLLSEIQKHSLTNFISKNNLNEGRIYNLVSDLLRNRGKSIVYAGDSCNSDTHYAVILLNEVLENTNIYDFENGFNSVYALSDASELDELVSNLNSGNVTALINFDSNPVFNLTSKGFGSAIENAGTVITFALTPNETSDVSEYVLPINHALESWGDAHTRVGVYSLQQPVINPIFNTREKEAEILTWISGNENKYSQDIFHSFLKANFNTYIGEKINPVAGQDRFWYASLHDGFVKLKPTESQPPVFQQTKLKATGKPSDNVLLQIQPSYFVGDGRYSNNGWLQELPHPVAKVAWDNFAAISPKYAENLGVENNDLIDISYGDISISIPVIIQPGTADNTIIVETGYGRKVCGDVGLEVGFDVNPLIDSSSINPYLVSGVSVSKGNGSYELVSVQEHHAIDDEFVKDIHKKRNIIQEGTLEEYKNHPHFLHEGKHEIFSITDEHEYNDVKWGMSIDLNKCTGCGICTASCSIENNVPVVGKDQVGVGREMSWIRIDRYYSGTPEEPEVSQQPMLCQHCDNAPCENVCPVNATNHSPDGLNQMAYNRCVGTRYCANNCPYKVRRFNFYNFRDHFEDSYYDNELTSLVNNPEVTVRSRGVMEKCTFCVQRIMDSRETAIREGRQLKGSDVTTACQQACPTNAIVFGDTNDAESEVSKYRNHELGYHVLEELNVKPNVTYLAKLRNTHSEDV
ncbi:MAG: TAT-variant-translocated molybdopterin oxidoreductase [Melioribacteraceae bacterium]|nr:TAT-variant-translocated molybdopterin oxidoreductase [Melioribacteraceae bacterium]MCF8264019.1 TAT-variant-translocated molybdopterin oxidoreductase [Melioribacteraceae bacterium]MCF8412703.1 TAT-variant-translocated molybdopterin oxidoreductase [Melioribacteraceae bacterium]MCF8432530.1 TAT-variant-translocated molybdopterin oxidoreductase [Melioribacteraceae bacterium]